jgi:hypothetical protein
MPLRIRVPPLFVPPATAPNLVFVRVAGVWVQGAFWVRVNGVWVQGAPSVKVSSTWN